MSEQHVASARTGLHLFAALAIAVVAQAVLAFSYGAAPGDARDSWHVVLLICLLLSLTSLGVIWTVWTRRNMPLGWSIALAIAAAGVLMRAPYFGAGPMLEDDHYRYLLDGAMVAHGMSPYTHAPMTVLAGESGVSSSFVEAGRSVIAGINFPDLRSIYPGGAQALFAIAHLIAPWSVDGLRVVIFGLEALTAILIWRALVSTGRAPILVALYWCNPLMAFCLTGQAHIDAALGAPVLFALIAASRHAAMLAGLGLGIAVGVKLWPVMLAPLVARVLWPNIRALVVFVATLGTVMLALCGPLMWASLSANAGLKAYAVGWSVNNAPYAWTSSFFLSAIGSDTGDRILRVLVMLVAAAASLTIAAREPAGLKTILSRAAILAGMLFYLSPAQFPWYAAWFMPLAAASGSWALVAASVGLPIYYLFFPLAIDGLKDIHGFGLAFLHLVPVVFVILLMRKRALSGVSA